MRNLSHHGRYLPLAALLCALLILFSSGIAAAAPRQQAGDATLPWPWATPASARSSSTPTA